MSVFIKWKGQTSSVDFKTQSLEFGDDEWQNHVSLGELLERISAASRVPVENMKLLHSGVLMKDVHAMLGSYGIKTGSKIMMLGDRIAKFPGGSPYGNTSPTFASSHSTAAAGSPRSVAKSKEEQQLDLLEGYEEHVRRELVPKLDHLKAELQRPASVFKDVSYLSREVGELLLQTQLKVDSVVSDNETVRAKRKQVTKFILGLEDVLDSLKPAITKKKSTL